MRTRLIIRAVQFALLILLGAYLVYFADHARRMLSFPYPLDYGEGPLLAQVERLRAGTPVWQLYGDPSAPPYQIVNYPPLYLILSAGLADLTGSTMVAGRLIALLSALGCVGALAALQKAKGKRQKAKGKSKDAPFLFPFSFSLFPFSFSLFPFSFSLFPFSFFLLPSLLLTVPIVREWAALMRVDLLGVCLGLWALVVMQKAEGRRQKAAPLDHVQTQAVASRPAPRAPRPTPRTVSALGSRLSALGYEARHILAGLLLLGCLFSKPSLVAAPLAAGGVLLWDLLRAPVGGRGPALRALLTLGLTVGVGGGLLVGLLQWASGGWFLLHVVAANANRWDRGLAWGFWEQQLRLRWPLFLAAGLVIWQKAKGKRQKAKGGEAAPPSSFILHPSSFIFPALYTLGGLITAVGVGKVGAYGNYFLELYVGLIWLVCVYGGRGSGVGGQGIQPLRHHAAEAPPLARARARGTGGEGHGAPLIPLLLSGLLVAALLYYPPRWDANRLRPAGLIEPSPPRLAFGGYGLWDDMRREGEVLAAMGRVYAALLPEVRAAGPLVFSDMPGVPAAAGVGSRLQAFEARQLLDQGLADEAALRLALANGELPLAVIDYLGNWLSPQVAELIRRRYAHDGALGTFDRYRPVDPGPLQAADLQLPAPGGDLRITGYRLAAPLSESYEPGELVVLALRMQKSEVRSQRFNSTTPMDATSASSLLTSDFSLLTSDFTIHLNLLDSTGAVVSANQRPLLYGAFPPEQWPAGAAVEHLQPFTLPEGLPAGRYTIAVALGDGAPQALGQIAVARQGGRRFVETGHFVPGPVLRAWAGLGGVERVGYPLTPLVPFSWGRLQCFERACLELRGADVAQRPLGEQLYLAETLRTATCTDGAPHTTGRLCPAFAAAPERYAELGEAVSGEIDRYGWLVQWTAYARLERAYGSDTVQLGRLGDDSLRLPPGVGYRWP